MSDDENIEEEDFAEEEDTEDNIEYDYDAFDDFDTQVEEPVNKSANLKEKEVKKEETVESAEVRAKLAVMLKEQGNQFFSKGDMEAALRCYTKAMEHDVNNPHLHLNKGKYEKLLPYIIQHDI